MTDLADFSWYHGNLSAVPVSPGDFGRRITGIGPSDDAVGLAAAVALGRGLREAAGASADWMVTAVLTGATDVGGSTPPRSPRTGDEGGSTPSNGPRSDMGARGPGDTGHL